MAEQQQAYIEEMDKRASLELAYDNFRNQILDRYIEENYPRDKFQALVENKKQELSHKYRNFAFWKPEALAGFLNATARSDLEKNLEMPTIESFRQKMAG